MSWHGKTITMYTNWLTPVGVLRWPGCQTLHGCRKLYFLFICQLLLRSLVSLQRLLDACLNQVIGLAYVYHLKMWSYNYYTSNTCAYIWTLLNSCTEKTSQGWFVPLRHNTLERHIAARRPVNARFACNNHNYATASIRKNFFDDELQLCVFKHIILW